jgi:uncharacterized protein (TIGR02145 family)
MKFTSGWLSPNAGAINESGFFGLPGGYRNFNGSFNYLVGVGRWWSNANFDSNQGWWRQLFFGDSGVERNKYSKQAGASVRCVRD